MSTAENKTLRTTPEDRKILKALEKKLGVGFSQIFRIALRRLAEHEGVKAA
jgi:hypothetical protein